VQAGGGTNDSVTLSASIGDVTIALVSAADDVTITATTGAIDEVTPEDAGIDITGDVLTLNAQDGVGQSHALEIDVNSLNSTITAPGNITIHENGAIILTDVSTTDGTITVTAGGLITATSVNASGAGQDVNLSTTTGGMTLTSVLADDDITATADAGDIVIDVVGDAGTDDVTITATTGSINGADDDDDAAEITADAVVLTAQDEIGGTIGGATAIETEVTTISADSTSAGDIIFKELDNDGDGINLLAIDANNGNITIQTNGGTQEAGTETTVTSVKSDTGVVGVHDISITAQTGDITLAGNTSDTTNVQSDDDITITATAGSITEDSTVSIPGDSYVDIQGDLLTITARDEIGSSTGEYDIETTVATLDASSTTAGDIVITETDAIVLQDVDTVDGSITIAAGGLVTATDVNASGTGQDVTLTTTTGGMILTSVLADDDITATADAGDVTVGVVGDAGTDDIAVTATTGSINEIGAGDAAVDFTGDALTLTAQDEIGGIGELDIETTVSSLTASSTLAGSIYITETNAITLTSVTTTDGLVNITSDGAMTVTEVTAGGDTGSNDDVTLTTTSGSIIQSGNITALNDEVTLASAGNITDTTDGTTDISAANLTITANSGTVGAVGANNELDTDVDTLTLSAQGSAYVLEQDAITLTSVVTTDGLIDIEAAGNITTTTVTAGGVNNGVNLNSTAGNIADTAGGMITAGHDSTFMATGLIGTNANPLDVAIGGDLWVWAGTSVDQVSANLQGWVSSSAVSERVEVLTPIPPGLIIFNNHLMGGDNYGSGSDGGSILSYGYLAVDSDMRDMFDPFYERAVQSWGYQVNHPWSLLNTAVIRESLMEGPSSGIDASGIGVNTVPSNLRITPSELLQENYYVIRAVTK
ncbi:MAG: hypothetical protein KKH08_06965, partial [Candidatus Omnitrophica bacterium]|nr:hypothetical protein [Candidatus Omnitrophota bacterium]